MKASIQNGITFIEQQANYTWFVLFILITALINLLQASFTGILNDEAYYWYYAQNPSFGYFDHPPMVAWWIYVGQLFFEGTLGVRCLAISAYAFIVLACFKILNLSQKPTSIPLFIAVCIGFAMLNIYGFIMSPDTPMLFFAAAFLWVYKLFLENERWSLALLLGICMAGMVYSKYHSVLFLALVVFSNIRLLKNLKFLTAVVLSLVLFAPHFLWLINNDWAPIQFHFVDRSTNEFKLSNVLNTVVNVLAIGGLLSPLLIYALIKSKTKTTFERTLKVVFWGFVVFFIYQSFKSKTQAQWFILLLFPLIYIGVNYARENQRFKRWIFILSSITLACIGYLRLAFVFEALLPISHQVHENTQWPYELKKHTLNYPVVFDDSYREPSVFGFSFKERHFAINSIYYRKSQYNLNQSIQEVRGKEVFYITTRKPESFDFQVTRSPKHQLYGVKIDSFIEYGDLVIEDLNNLDFKDDAIYGTFKIKNPYNEKVQLSPDWIYAFLFKKNKRNNTGVKVILERENPLVILPKDSIEIDLKIPFSSEIRKEYSFLRLALREFGFMPGHQGEWIPLRD